jgi:hypothetical protein
MVHVCASTSSLSRGSVLMRKASAFLRRLSVVVGSASSESIPVRFARILEPRGVCRGAFVVCG